MTESAGGETVKIEVREEPAWRRVIDVEIPAGQVTAAYTRVFKQYQKDARLPGFRPGKVPLEVIERRYGSQALRDVLDLLVPPVLTQAYRDHGLVPISDPELSNFKLDPGEPMSFRATVDVRPDVEPKAYTGLVLQKPSLPVREEHIDETVEHIRERRAEFVARDQAAMRGDWLLCDLVESSTGSDGRPNRRELTEVTLELNPERLYPELADGLLGVRAGESRGIDMTHPEASENKDLAGRKVHYDVSVKEVRVRQLPELTPEFLKTLADDVASVEDLRARVRADLEMQAAAEVRRAVNSEIIREVVTRNDFELPQSLVNEYLSRLWEDLKKSQPEIKREEVDAQYRELGVRQVRWEFLYHAIAGAEKIEVTDADVDGWLERFAQHEGVALEKVKADLAGSNRVARIRDNILEAKVLDFLFEKATVTELPVQTQLIQPPGAGAPPKKKG
jgi:trigger factor